MKCSGSYVIYFSGKRGANPNHFVDAGLPLVVGEGAEFADVLDGGPDDGGRGLIAAWSRTGNSFRVSDYTWQPAKADEARGLAAGRFFIGTPRGGVQPKDIAKKQFVAGYELELADNQVWRVARIVNLPKRIGLNDQGRVSVQFIEQYRSLIELADRYCVQFFEAVGELEVLKAAKPGIDTNETVTLTLLDGWSFACDILALNYRLCPEIIDALGILDERAVRNIVKAAIDLTALLESEPLPDEQQLSVPINTGGVSYRDYGID